MLPLLLTLSSGIQGFTTVHAGSARQALTRLRFIAQLADTANEIPMSALNSLISETVDLVVHCHRTPSGLRVNEIIAVEELAGGNDATAFTVTEVFNRAAPEAPMRWTGQVPVRLSRMLERHGHDVRSLLDAADHTQLSRRSPTGERS